MNDDVGAAWQRDLSLSMDTEGNFIICWHDNRNDDWDIYAQRYNSLGDTLGANFRVNSDFKQVINRIPRSLWRQMVVSLSVGMMSAIMTGISMLKDIILMARHGGQTTWLTRGLRLPICINYFRQWQFPKTKSSLPGRMLVGLRAGMSMPRL